MNERFDCPHCGKELTEVGVRLHKLQQDHDELESIIQNIMKKVFDFEELDRISDRLEDKNAV